MVSQLYQNAIQLLIKSKSTAVNEKLMDVNYAKIDEFINKLSAQMKDADSQYKQKLDELNKANLLSTYFQKTIKEVGI